MKDSLILSDDYIFGVTLQGEGPFSLYWLQIRRCTFWL